MKLRTILSLGLLIAFFLPWIDLTFFTLSGYNIPISLDKLATIGNWVNTSDDTSIYKISYVLYLIPIFCTYNIIVGLSKKEAAFFLNEFLVGLICSGFFYFFISSYGEKVTSILSIGYYLTASISLFGVFESVVAFFNKIENNPLNQSRGNNEKDKEISSEEKEALLKQLEQLYSLKEKGFLTDEIYEQERKLILAKFEKSEPQKVEEEINIKIEKQEPEENEKVKTKKPINKKAIITISLVALIVFTGVFFFFYYKNLQIAKNDWEKMKLKNKVKSIEQRGWIEVFDFEHEPSMQKRPRKQKINFDEKGFITTDSCSYQIYKFYYDENGFKTKEINLQDTSITREGDIITNFKKNENGSITVTYIDVGINILNKQYLDANKNIILDSEFYDLECVSRSTYKYDHSNNLIEKHCKYLKAVTGENDSDIITYNDKGLLETITYYQTVYGKERICKFTYNYEYDKYGNWIKSTLLDNKGLICDKAERLIEYY
jgi:hypothetical protein